MSNSDYTEKLKDHFRNPRNLGIIENPEAEATVGNPRCGDVMKITLRIKDNVIEDAKFQTFGCAAAVATSSITTEMIKGKTLDEVREMKNQDVVDALGGMPPIKVHCSLLAIEALNKALGEYEKGNK
jgi:nitrogen fixation NifU-like protein